MAEPALRPLFQRPSPVVRPKARYFVSNEPGAHAHRRVVARHPIAADGPKLAAEGERPARPARLDGDEHSRNPRYPPQKFGQSRVIKMMQEQIRDHDIVAGLTRTGPRAVLGSQR